MRVGFRRLVDEDLPMLHRWLNEPGVVRWWEGYDVSWHAVVRDYGSACEEPVEHWIATIDGRDVGWIQCYAAADNRDETEHWWALGVDPMAAGIDYLVGEPSDRGAGIGSAMIRAFVVDVVFGRHPEWTQACAGPYAENIASWRALDKAGFRFAGIIDDEDGPCRLMVADRTTISPGPSGPRGSSVSAAAAAATATAQGQHHDESNDDGYYDEADRPSQAGSSFGSHAAPLPGRAEVRCH